MFPLQTTTEGVLLPIKAAPGARANQIRGLHRGRLKVAVTQIAEKGKANRAVVELLSKQLKLSKSCFTLTSGATDSKKTYLVSHIGAEELEQRVKGLLDGG